jgi:hypothetical protein
MLRASGSDHNGGDKNEDSLDDKKEDGGGCGDIDFVAVTVLLPLLVVLDLLS